MGKDERTVVGRVAETVDSAMYSQYKRLGENVARRPCLTMGLSFFVFVLTVLGAVFNFETESRGEKLWIPQDTKALDDRDVYETYFPRNARYNTVVLEVVDPSDSMLTKDVLTKVFELFDTLQEHRTSVAPPQNLTQLCLPGFSDGYPCVITGVLGKWMWQSSLLALEPDDASVLATINADDAVEDLKRYLGQPTTDGAGAVTSAPSIRLDIFLENREEVVDNEEVDPVGDDWEEFFLDLFEGKTFASAGGVAFRAYPWATRSFSDEFGSVITGDVLLVNVSFLIIFIYMALNLGDFTRVKSRVALSLACIVTVGMSIGTSIGLASAFGQFYGPVNSVLPFVLLGLGVDDSFVITSAFDSERPRPGEVVEDRVARALGHAGVSITVTSVTDFVAFAISTATVLPGLSTFCAYAAIGILALFAYQVTFFTAALTLDARRQRSNRYDCCCCLPTSGGDVAPADAAVAVAPPKQGMVNKFLELRFAPAIVRPGVREAIALGFAAMFGVFCHAATLLSVESSERSFIPDGSYLLDTFDKIDFYFGDTGYSCEVVTLNMDYHAAQAALLDLKARFSGRESRAPFIKEPASAGSGYESWIEEFISYKQATAPGDLVASGDYSVVADEGTFYEDLAAWLEGDGSQYESDVVFESSGTAISASRVHFEFISFIENDPRGGKRDDTDKQVEAMDEMRRLVDGMGDLNAFAWSYEFLNWETFKIIYQELTQNIGLALLAVAVITLVLIAHPLTSGLVFVCVAMTIVDILGAMFYWNIVVDNVSVIMLTLSVGLSVDYAAHVGHHWMVVQGTKDERVAKTLGGIGAAVLNGALSTFLAVCLLAGSGSYVFRTLFRLFFLTVVLGVGHGMILLPVLLHIMGPKPYKDEPADSHGVGQLEGAAADALIKNETKGEPSA